VWFSTFFEKALVSRVKRRMDIRLVRFCRSTKLVETCFRSGLPVTRWRRHPMHFAGLWRGSSFLQRGRGRSVRGGHSRACSCESLCLSGHALPTKIAHSESRRAAIALWSRKIRNPQSAAVHLVTLWLFGAAAAWIRLAAGRCSRSPNLLDERAVRQNTRGAK
jgi:hypothetical protein